MKHILKGVQHYRKDKSPESYDMYLQAIQLGENRRVQQTPRFISTLVIKLVKTKHPNFLDMMVLNGIPN